jgi:modulator of FtsH protease
VNHGFQPELWEPFFLATAGVGAALAGLVFVAFSINLRAILGTPGVIGRGAEALVLLLSPTFVALAGLWPADDPKRVGLLIALVGLLVWLEVTGIELWSVRGPGPSNRAQRGIRFALAQLGTLPTIVAGLSLAFGVSFGLDWLLLSVGFALVGGLIGAWVLLVEILR